MRHDCTTGTLVPAGALVPERSVARLPPGCASRFPEVVDGAPYRLQGLSAI